MQKTALMTLSIIFLGSLISGCGSSESAATSRSGQNTTVAQAASGDRAAAFSSSALDTRGTRRQMSEWVGQQPVVVNFWGTWCPPCRREIPELVRLYDEYNSRGVEIVSLAIRDTPAQVEQYAGQAGMKWVMLMAEENVADEFKLGSGVPTTIFFDKNGNEQARFQGARDYATFKTAFEKIASES